MSSTLPLSARGSNGRGSRQYNERVLLQAVRLHGGLAGAEISRVTGLTAQSVSQISKRLLGEGLLMKGAPVRGKVGQPSVPLLLDPTGAYAIGLQVGRRGLDVLLVDFTGQVCRRSHTSHEYADPDALLAEIGRRLGEIERELGPDAFARVQGIGIAAPLSLGGWQALLALPADVVQRWQHIDLAAAVGEIARLPVTLIKDTSAACMAELVAGRGRQVKSFLYLFVDTFIGGGLVLDSRLHPGLSGNAGAVGSAPLACAPSGSREVPAQLLSVASLLRLERAYADAGLDAGAALDGRALSMPWLPHTRAWAASAGAAVAQTLLTAICVLDIDSVILDGAFGRELLLHLLDETALAMDRYNWEGVRRPSLLAGTIGSDARALGGALFPLHASFAPDRDLFLTALPAA